MVSSIPTVKKIEILFSFYLGLVALTALACLRHWVCIYYIDPQSLLALLVMRVQQSGFSGLKVYQVFWH